MFNLESRRKLPRENTTLIDGFVQYIHIANKNGQCKLASKGKWNSQWMWLRIGYLF